jgi:hypothetical protein
MMMKTYQMMSVEQSAARYTTAKHNRRHTCDKLGMCQCEGPASVPGDDCQREEPTPSPFEKMVDAIIITALSGFTIGVSFGIGNWYYGWMA